MLLLAALIGAIVLSRTDIGGAAPGDDADEVSRRRRVPAPRSPSR